MTTSEKIGALVEALSKAKASMRAPKKGRTANAGKYTYNYADRADVIESYASALAGSGLALVHSISMDESMHTVLRSRLMHSSGEWIESSYPIPNVDDAQTLGSWLTYLERYQSCALLDIAAEDDDDGARAKKPAREEAVDPQSLPFYDLRLAIKDAGEELEQRGGGLWPEHVRKASAFTDKSGKAVSGFPDPFNPKVKSEAWLKSTLGKLTAALAESEPGAEEGAAALT